ncbi:MFS transporter [Streptomyces glaucosporus]|uniref:MFS transporter n=1 Tax=Streptomyces glaucosporus TaxID=284044 RepID=A0ABN3I616_9ACTN
MGLATFSLLYATQPLLPALTADFGVTPGQASWTVSAATIGLAVAVLPLSALSERFGRRTMMTCSLAVAVAVALVLPLAPNIEVLIALRALQGAAIAGIPASAMAYLADELPPRALVGAVGLFVAGNSVGGMSGRVLTGWAAEGWGWRAGLASVAAVSLVCAVVYRLLIPRARNFTPASIRPAAVLRTVRGHLSDGLLLRLYSLGLLFMTVFGAVYTVIGYRLVAEPFGLSQGLVGSLFVVYLVGTVSSAAAGRLVGRLGRRGALYLAIGTTATGLLVSLGESLASVLTGLVLITAGFFAGHAVASSSVSRTAQEGRAQASALYQMAYYLGSSLGASLGAVAYHAAGWSATVAFALGALVLAAGVTLYATRRALVRRRLEAVRSC